MNLSISKKFLLIVSGIIMISIIVSYLIFHIVIKERYTQNFINEMGKAKLVLSNYLDNRFLLIDSGIKILLSNPRFLASIAEGDPQTVQEEISDFRSLVNADFLIIADTAEIILAQESRDDTLEFADLDLYKYKFGSELNEKFTLIGNSIYQLISTPIYFFTGFPMGNLFAGYNVDNNVIEIISQLTGCEIAVVSNNMILIDTQSEFNSNQGEFLKLLGRIDRMISGEIYTIRQDGEDFLILPYFYNLLNY